MAILVFASSVPDLRFSPNIDGDLGKKRLDVINKICIYLDIPSWADFIKVKPDGYISTKYDKEYTADENIQNDLAALKWEWKEFFKNYYRTIREILRDETYRSRPIGFIRPRRPSDYIEFDEMFSVNSTAIFRQEL